MLDALSVLKEKERRMEAVGISGSKRNPDTDMRANASSL